MSIWLRSLAMGAFASSLLVMPHRGHAQGVAGSLLAAELTASEVSAQSGFATAVLKVLHPDGILLWPGAPVVAGRADVQRLLAAQATLDSLRLTWQALGVELARDSTLGVTWGVAVATPRSSTAPLRIGRYIAAWRREGGQWAIAALALLGISAAHATTVPLELPLRRLPLKPSGDIGPFAAADLAFAQLAADSGAAVAFERWAAPEATMFDRSGLLIRGPKAISQLVAGPTAWRWHPVAAGAASDLGWTVGEAVIAPPAAEPTYSKYLTLWVRLPGGAVRFLFDGGNTRPATP